MHLTTKIIEELCDQPLAEITKIEATDKEITTIDDDISTCKQLHKLILADNALSGDVLSPLNALKSLTFLNLSNNQLTSLKSLKYLSELNGK